jgi:hypothetical protein
MKARGCAPTLLVVDAMAEVAEGPLSCSKPDFAGTTKITSAKLTIRFLHHRVCRPF